MSLEAAVIHGIDLIHSPQLSVRIMSSKIKLVSTPYDDFGITHFYNGIEIEHFQCEMHIDNDEVIITKFWTSSNADEEHLAITSYMPTTMSLSTLRELARGELNEL